jgi:hypothetical protein
MIQHAQAWCILYHRGVRCVEDDYTTRLRCLFHQNLVLDLPTILQAFPGRSRCSIFRDLKAIGGHLSSYNHNSRFFTLADVPRFDANGFWQSPRKGLSVRLPRTEDTPCTLMPLERTVRARFLWLMADGTDGRWGHGRYRRNDMIACFRTSKK